jgi:hypothetical protein
MKTLGWNGRLDLCKPLLSSRFSRSAPRRARAHLGRLGRGLSCVDMTRPSRDPSLRSPRHHVISGATTPLLLAAAGRAPACRLPVLCYAGPRDRPSRHAAPASCSSIDRGSRTVPALAVCRVAVVVSARRPSALAGRAVQLERHAHATGRDRRWAQLRGSCCCWLRRLSPAAGWTRSRPSEPSWTTRERPGLATGSAGRSESAGRTSPLLAGLSAGRCSTVRAAILQVTDDVSEPDPSDDVVRCLQNHEDAVSIATLDDD